SSFRSRFRTTIRGCTTWINRWSADVIAGSLVWADVDTSPRSVDKHERLTAATSAIVGICNNFTQVKTV
ncbi:MAG TPA: hypothetical protein VFD63_12540, partial [Pyrinomonadaceae bacterium]|nr:hypothetical protein [Pyrinomonadaceae bacterium]